MTTAIIDAIANATEKDLDELKARIAELTRELDSLKWAEKLLEIRLRGKEIKRRQQRPAKSPVGGYRSQPSELATEIYDVLSKRGPCSTAELAEELDANPQAVGVVAGKHHWFTRLANGKYLIATTGGKEQSNGRTATV